MLLIISLLPVILQCSFEARQFLLIDLVAAALVKVMFTTGLQRLSLKAFSFSLLPYFTWVFFVSPLEQKLCEGREFCLLFPLLPYSLIEHCLTQKILGGLAE